MITWTVYKHTSLRSGKSYVGMTKNTVSKRWTEHKSSARAGSSNHFHRAIRLYGDDNWKTSILADKIDTVEEAAALECYHIKNEDTFENGYNGTTGGEGTVSRVITDEFRYNMADRTEHTFYHPVHGEVTTFRRKLCDTYGLEIGQLTHMLTNPDSRHAKLWTTSSTYVKFLKDRLESDAKIHEFIHKDGSTLFVNVLGMASMLNVRPCKVRRVISGVGRTKGWSVKLKEIGEII